MGKETTDTSEETSTDNSIDETTNNKTNNESKTDIEKVDSNNNIIENDNQKKGKATKTPSSTQKPQKNTSEEASTDNNIDETTNNNKTNNIKTTTKTSVNNNDNNSLAELEQLRKENTKLKIANKYHLTDEQLNVLGEVDDNFEKRAKTLANMTKQTQTTTRDPNIGQRLTKTLNITGNDWLRGILDGK